MKLKPFKIKKAIWCRLVLFTPFLILLFLIPFYIFPDNKFFKLLWMLFGFPIVGLPSYFILVLGILLWGRRKTAEQIKALWIYLPLFYIPVLILTIFGLIAYLTFQEHRPWDSTQFVGASLLFSFMAIVLAIPFSYLYVALFYALTKALKDDGRLVD